MAARFVVLLALAASILSLAGVRAEAAPAAELQEALQTFRTDGPKGWSYVQTSEGAGESRVERFDAARPEFERWSLLRIDGHAPTPEDLRDYRDNQLRRLQSGNAPLLTDRLETDAAQLVRETAETATYRCPLKPGEPGDDTAANLSATLVLHRPTHTIEALEIASVRPFSPTFAVHIVEMRTTMTYSLPDAARPSFLTRATTHVRGRAFLFKSLDQDLIVTFDHFERAHR